MARGTEDLNEPYSGTVVEGKDRRKEEVANNIKAK